ncbi:MAG: dihydroorotase [Candidatus Omnitrophica bacterium]|nr:dihydroorotase [Candidatus Omnitrophota bacterium]
MKILIKNGRLIDPANKIDQVLDILVDNTKIVRLDKNITNGQATVIDATNKIVMPALVDMHVHLRQPGREDKETIFSGTQAAVHGGVGTVLAMPNTEPPIDSPEQIRLLKKIISQTANAKVLIAATITVGRQGKELTPIAQLKKEGAVAITDDGSSVDSAEILAKAMVKARQAKILIISHCEDKTLSQNGVMNLGAMSTRLGLRGIPNASEYKRVQRDIELAAKTKCRLHIAHVSCQESVEIIAKAKKKGIMVTAETAPHYFSLTEKALFDYDTNKKMNPPLRTDKDVAAIKDALSDGTIDAIASDHAPHTMPDKDIEFDHAEFGVIGLETELAVSITNLVETKHLSWLDLAKVMSLNPARILGIDRGNLSVGKSADLIVVDPVKTWQVRKEEFLSKSKNSCFLGMQLKGKVLYTILGGKIVYKVKDSEDISH